MFQVMISPIFKNTSLCVTAYGIMHPQYCRQATSWVHYTTSCNTQSSALKDGRNHRPKHVELIGIINKPLLLHLVGCLLFVLVMHGETNIKFRYDVLIMEKFSISVLWVMARNFVGVYKGFGIPYYVHIQGEMGSSVIRVTILKTGNVQVGSNMTGTDLCVNKPHCAAAVRL